MIKFAFKNLMSRKEKVILGAISILVATTIALLAINVSKQINDGIVKTVGYYDTIIGPAGSETDLVLNTMFFISNPAGLVDMETYEEIKNDPNVNVAIPFASGDTYKDSKIIGTTTEFLKDFKLAQGKLFADEFELVVGSEIAKTYNLKIGDKVVSSHGQGVEEHADNPYTVVGILGKTYTAYDTTTFTTIESVWHAHGHHEDDAEEAHEHEEEAHEHEEEGHHHELGVTAILIKSKSLNAQNEIRTKYSEYAGIQAVNPNIVLRNVMNSIDVSKTIVYFLCIVIGVLAFLIVYITTLQLMQDASKDIKLMRLIGISKKEISKVLYLQNIFISVCGIITAMILSRILLFGLNNTTKSMGIVLNYTKIYTDEMYMLLAIFVIALIPIILQIHKKFKEDPIYEK